MTLSPEHTVVVREMWLKGFTGGGIVAHFGGAFTRNQILGKLYRLGLLGDRMKKKATTVQPETKVTKRRQRRGEATVLRPKSLTGGLLTPTAIPLATPSNAAQRSFNSVCGPSYNLIDLDHRSCKWPIGHPGEANFCFCAAPAESGPYCNHHHRIAHERPETFSRPR